MMTTLKFHVKGLFIGLVFLAAFLSPVIAGVSFLALVRVTWGA